MLPNRSPNYVLTTPLSKEPNKKTESELLCIAWAFFASISPQYFPMTFSDRERWKYLCTCLETPFPSAPGNTVGGTEQF